MQTIKIENGNGYNITAGLASGSEIVPAIQSLFADHLPDIDFGMAHYDGEAAVVRLIGNNKDMMTTAYQNTSEIAVSGLFVLVISTKAERQVLQHLRQLAMIETIHISTCKTIGVLTGEFHGRKDVIGMTDDYVSGSDK
jgi:adenosine/AMP kinase